MTDGTRGLPAGYLTVRDAARRAGRSVRTVDRWVEAGRVETLPHPADRRRRLVAIASLDRAAQGIPETGVKSIRPAVEEEVDRAAVLATLRGLSWQVSLISAQMGMDLQELADQECLDSPLANQLWLLIGVVRGTRLEPPDVIQQALADVLLTLYSDPVTRHVVVPDEFWSTTLIGQHLARAQLLLHPGTGLVNLHEIVVAVSMPRVRVANILQAIGAERLYDPDEGRWVYPRGVIAAVQSWDASKSMQDPEATDVAEDLQAIQPQVDSTFVDCPPAENRRRIRAIRDAYHRRYFRVPVQ